MKKNKTELTPRQIKSAETKRRIFESYYKLATSGNESITVQDICDEANVAIGTFYHFYSSKDEVAREIYKELDIYLKEQEYPNSPNEKIKSVMHAMLDWSTRAGVAFMRNSILFEANNNPEFSTPKESNANVERTFHSVTSDIIIEALEEGKKEGIYKLNHETYFYSDMIIFMFRGILYYWTVNDGNYDVLKTLDLYLNHILESISVK